MNKKAAMLALVLVLPLSSVAAQATAPASIVPADRFRVLADSLTPGASRTAQLGKGPGLTYAVTHRDSTGGLEVHRDWTDLFVIESGSGMLLSGGALSGGTESKHGEWRGGNEAGATNAALHGGDVVGIADGTLT